MILAKNGSEETFLKQKYFGWSWPQSWLLIVQKTSFEKKDIGYNDIRMYTVGEGGWMFS